MTAAARAELRRLLERWRAIADTYDVNAEEWRRRSTPEEPHAVAVAERTMAALIYRACATDADALPALLDRVEALEEALREIGKGEGRFSLDRYEHACNTIESMKAIAARALSVAPATRLTEGEKK